MALTERSRIREVLIVQDDATLAWHVHQVPITEILRDGAVVQATYGAAQPLALADVEGVLSEAFVSITNDRDAEKTAKEEVQAALEAEQTAHGQAEQRLSWLIAQIQASPEGAAAFVAELVAQQAEQ